MSTQTQPTVAELEARILAGQTVTPDQMAAVRAAEDAAQRIAELTRQREEAEALTDRKRRAHAAADAIAADFRSFVSTSDETFKDALAQIVAAVSTYHERSLVHNAELSNFRRQIEIASAIEPQAPIDAASSADGRTNCGETVTSFLVDWESDVRRTMEQAVVSSKAAVNTRKALEEQAAAEMLRETEAA